MIFHCLYLSRAVRTYRYDEVHRLLETSRNNNASSSLTGILIYKNNYFVQWIEGGQQSVMDLYLKIEKDDRHVDPIILHQWHHETRVFPDWSMGFSHLSVISGPDGETINSSLVPDQWPPDPAGIETPGIDILLNFVQGHQ